ncbi:MAG: ScpA family protein [bacterium]
MHQVTVGQFNGPLHLLLSLIEQEELNISELSLSEVTDQFIRYVESGTVETEELADWLVVAAKLLWIKSQTLLPGEIDMEADPNELAKQLKIYKAYLDAMKGIEVMIKKGKHCYVRTETVRDLTPRFSPPASVMTSVLVVTFQQILARLAPVVQLPKMIMEKTMTIQEKMAHIKDILLKRFTAKFSDLFKDNGSKLERIISFLAVLELVKMRAMDVEQPVHFQDIHIKVL